MQNTLEYFVRYAKRRRAQRIAHWDVWIEKVTRNLEENFFKLTGQKLVKKQFKNKWDLLKKEYTEFMVLKKAASGLGWNDAMSTIVADDDWGNNHLQKYPKHAKWRTRGPANLKEMDVMFDKAHVTGATTSIPGELSSSDEDVQVIAYRFTILFEIANYVMRSFDKCDEDENYMPGEVAGSIPLQGDTVSSSLDGFNMNTFPDAIANSIMSAREE